MRRVHNNDRSAVVRHPALEILVTRTERGGCCFHTGTGCLIHRETGERARPVACRRFPFDALRTPDGLRVTTEHRCPCRTMGDRPLLTEDEVRAALADRAGRIRSIATIERIPMTRRSRVSFARWRAIEAGLLRRLGEGDRPEDVVGEEPFAPLRGIRWLDVAHHLRAHVDGTKGGEALAWAGDAILSLTSEHRAKGRSRPWRPSFDRAEARSPEADADPIVADWIADVLWDLAWTELVPYDVLQKELATRLAVVRWSARAIVREGGRADRAAAEAVMIGELLGATGVWDSVREAL